MIFNSKRINIISYYNSSSLNIIFLYETFFHKTNLPIIWSYDLATKFWIKKVTRFLFRLLLCVLKNRIVIMIQFVHLTDKWDTKCSNIYQAFLSTKRLLNNGQSRKRCQQKNMHPRKQCDFHKFVRVIPTRSIFRIYSSIFNQQSVFRFKCKLSQMFSSVPSIH